MGGQNHRKIERELPRKHGKKTTTSLRREKLNQEEKKAKREAAEKE